MRDFTRKVCQRTTNFLFSYNVTGFASRGIVFGDRQLKPSYSVLRHRVSSRLYSSYRRLPSRNLARTDAAKESVARIELLGLPESELSKPELFTVPLAVIEQRLQYCVESGIKSCSECVTTFHQIINNPVSVLKTAGMISEKTDVIQRIMNNIKFVGPHPSIENDLPFGEIHFKVLNHCMEYEHGYSFAKWQRYLEAPVMYAHRNMISFKEAGLNWLWIRNHPSLLCFANPHNLFKIFELDRSYELPMAIPNVLRRDADIAFVPYEDLRAIFFILKKYNVCTHDISKVYKMEHFLVNPEHLNRQFQKIDTTPALDKNNLLLLHRENLILSEKKRSLDHLEKLIARQCNPYTNLVSSHEGSWQHEMKLWLDSGDFVLECRPCGHNPFTSVSDKDYVDEYKEISYTVDEKKMELLNKKRSSKLQVMMSEELNLPIQQVKAELAHMPLALTVETKQSYETLMYLKSRGFSNEEIRGTLQLLLYERDIVAETLENQIFPDEELQSMTYRGRQLHVCLYLLLMKYNFNINLS